VRLPSVRPFMDFPSPQEAYAVRWVREVELVDSR
jgi:hypothetical protein